MSAEIAFSWGRIGMLVALSSFCVVARASAQEETEK